MGFVNICGHWIYAGNINSESIIIDLGANIGGFTKEIKNRFHCPCYVVEPNEELFRNIDNESSATLNAAITKFHGPVTFYLSHNHEASSLIHEFEHHWAQTSELLVEGVSWKPC